MKTVSVKVQLLLGLLTSQEPDVSAIVFVKERNTVTILSQMLSLVPPIRSKYRIGMATAVGKRDMWDLSRSLDLEGLQEFRAGTVNLLVATSVLEEGIDVPACNLVICFDKPPTLKSFIQRRGRARMRDSELILLLENSPTLLQQYGALEEEMKKQYEDQERELRALQEIEDSDVAEQSCFVVGATGARLDFDSAKPHLEHFCRILSPGEYVDSRPDYIIQDADDNKKRAVIVLPTYIPAEVRVARSERTWKSEKNATKDAAFQAYLALYKAGLINDNLRPLKSDDLLPRVEIREGEIQVNGRLDPWPRVAEAWTAGEALWRYSLKLFDAGGVLQGEYCMELPVQLPPLRPITAHLDQNTTWTIEFGDASGPLPMGQQTEDDTAVLLALPFSHRWRATGQQHVVRFIAKNKPDLELDQLAAVSFSDVPHVSNGFPYLVRDKFGCPYKFQGYIDAKPPRDQVQHRFYEFETAPDDIPYLSLKKWTRRMDFLHLPQGEMSTMTPGQKPYSHVYPVAWTKVDKIPLTYAYCGMLIPTIMQEIEIYLVAGLLMSTTLQPIGMSNVDLVLSAISSRSASEATDYERLEFLGDSLLKFCATVNVTAQSSLFCFLSV